MVQPCVKSPGLVNGVLFGHERTRGGEQTRDTSVVLRKRKRGEISKHLRHDGANVKSMIALKSKDLEAHTYGWKRTR